MKKVMFVVAILLAWGLAKPAMAQDENRFSVYGGYYFVHTSVNVGETYTATLNVSPQGTFSSGSSIGLNFNGGGGQFAYNFNQDSPIKFGVVADFAGYHSGSHGADLTIINYLFGPRFTFGQRKLQPFAQALFGGARASESGFSNNAFAMTVGGGLDYYLGKHLFVRPVQAEYMLTKFNFGTNTQNSFRYSAGVGFSWP